MLKVIIAVVIGAVALISTFLAINSTMTVPSQTTIVDDTTYYTVTIEGEVLRPGTYSLDIGSTMDSLITSAGGVSDNADSLAYYTDVKLANKATYYIAPKYDENDVCSTSPIAKVNINTDNQETLISINGITSSIASSIISYRTSTKTFETIEELMEVYGIGNATYKKVRDYVTLHA